MVEDRFLSWQSVLIAPEEWTWVQVRALGNTEFCYMQRSGYSITTAKPGLSWCPIQFRLTGPGDPPAPEPPRRPVGFES